MLFSDNIPEKLKEHLTVSSFINVLDGLQNYKREIIGSSLRVSNPAVLMDRTWLLKRLTDFGIDKFPEDYPIEIIQLLILNVDTLFRLRGSVSGFKLYCSLMSLGEVSLDNFIQTDPQYIELDTIDRGYAIENSETSFLYLADNSEDLMERVSFTLNISSRFFTDEYKESGDLIKKYLRSSVQSQLGFSRYTIDFNFMESDHFYYHPLLNPYFV